MRQDSGFGIQASTNFILFCCAVRGLAQSPPLVSFQAMVNYPVGPSPSSVAVGDFNGDGILDLAGADSNGVSVLLGNANGTFQPAVNYATDGAPNAVVAADLRNGSW